LKLFDKLQKEAQVIIIRYGYDNNFKGLIWNHKWSKTTNRKLEIRILTNIEPHTKKLVDYDK